MAGGCGARSLEGMAGGGRSGSYGSTALRAMMAKPHPGPRPDSQDAPDAPPRHLAALCILFAATFASPVAAQTLPPVHTDAATMAAARADSVKRPYTTADIAFVDGMIHHHAQAIVIAKWAPTHGASAEVGI